MIQWEHSAIHLTFIKLPFVIKIFVLSILEWPLKAGFTVYSYHPQAMVQKEQLAEELNNMKQRFDGHVQGTQQRLNEEREIVRKENKAINEELNTKVGEMILI